MGLADRELGDGAGRRAEWHRYYSPKRIVHQCQQLHMLDGLVIRRILEVGPYLGFVTALLDNAGYSVTTLDIFPHVLFARPHVPHIQADLSVVAPERIQGFDAVVCCETLEHLWWNDVPDVLGTFHASGAKFLLLSVPYAGTQFSISAYLNRFRFHKRTALKMFNHHRDFTVEDDPLGHKWEVGYRGRSLATYERIIRQAGWRIAKRDFTGTTRSVFHLCERADHD